MKFTIKKGLLILVMLVVTFVLWQWLNSPMTVTVVGMGKVSVPATSATITTTVSVNLDDAVSAIAGAKAKVDVVKSVLISSGIDESDISVSQITSYPAGLAVSGATGYQASIQIVAKTEDVAKVGDLIGTLYTAGASLVAQPVLSVENQDDLEAKASDEAIKDAKSQVAKIALKNLKFVKKVVYLSEETSATTSTASSTASGTDDLTKEMATNGVFEIAKAVTISYKLW